MKCIYDYRLISIVILIFCLFCIFNPGRHAKHYNYVSKYDILSELVESSEIKFVQSNLCSYEDIILQSHETKISDIFKKYYYDPPLLGGEFIPKKCTARYKVAIIIPYRNRQEQLNTFLNYVHSFLQNQNIHYKIYVIDQRDHALFNRAKMFNIGAYEAIKENFPCLILHDVDLIPLTTGNIYACAKRPRHMSSSLDTFRFNLPYEGLCGGVIAILSEQFQVINGMSNYFEGWGGEDDDLYSRLEANNFIPYRFPPELSKYTMLKHKKQKPSENRHKLLQSTVQRIKIDGLNALLQLTFNYTIIPKTLYTHIIVK